ncbi:HIT family protein [Streptomyces sp. NPDC004752]
MTVSGKPETNTVDAFRPEPDSDCMMCSEIEVGPSEVTKGRYIADLTASRLLLFPNQYVRGICMLISKTHATELHHLPATEAGGYFNDLLLSSAAVEEAFQPHKLNWEVLGNWVPHIHGFIKPRYLDDPIPDNRIPHDVPWEVIDEQEMDRRVELVRDALFAALDRAPRRLELNVVLDPRGDDRHTG